MTARLRPLLGIAAALFVLALPIAAYSECPRFGGTLCTAPGDQTQLVATRKTFLPVFFGHISTDLFAAWRDMRDSTSHGADIYLGSGGVCFDSSAAPGTPICTDDADQEHPAVAASGMEGGDVIGPNVTFGIVTAWEDHRGSDRDVYAHRHGFFPFGPWDSASVPIGSAAGDQSGPVVVGDGVHGGAIIGWVDRRGGASDIYAQRVDSTGASQWTANGIPICAAPGDQADLRGVVDGSDGAILCWLDRRASEAIYAARLTPQGVLAPGWNAFGNPVAASPAVPTSFVSAPDGSGGLFVAWTDTRSDAAGDVYATHLGPFGNPIAGWITAGTPVAATTRGERVSDIALAVDGGLYVVWEDDAQPGNTDLRAQHLDANGARGNGWPAAGIVVCDDPARQYQARVAARDEVDPYYLNVGMVVTWTDDRGGLGSPDIYALRITEGGSIPGGWTPNGTLVTGAPDAQDHPVIVPAANAACLIAWIDERDRASRGADVYAASVSAEGNVSVPGMIGGGIRIGAARPNPSGGPVSFTLDLASAGRCEARVVDVAGRSIRALFAGSLAAGRHTLTWDGLEESGERASPGLYFVRISATGTSLATRVILLQ